MEQKKLAMMPRMNSWVRVARNDPGAGIPHSPFPIPHSSRLSSLAPYPCRSAFTLVELLVVITILAILASLMLFALAGAQSTAIEMRTRSTIAKLNNLVMQKFESYRTRRLPMNVQDVARQKGYAQDATGWARARLDIVRELMRMEMPDGFSDIDDVPITKAEDASGNITKMQRPAVSRSYFTALTAARTKNSGAVGSTPLQQAMCLYLLVTRGCDDPDVMEQFAPHEINTDADTGLSYFVDGWGNAIYFLRWAPGYYSPLQPDPTAASGTPPAHDQFDPLTVYPASRVALYPLIYSAGPDGKYEVDVNNGLQYSQHDNDPYYSVDNPPPGGKPVGGLKDSDNDGNDGRIDNITNHDIQTR